MNIIHCMRVFKRYEKEDTSFPIGIGIKKNDFCDEIGEDFVIDILTIDEAKELIEVLQKTIKDYERKLT